MEVEERSGELGFSCWQDKKLERHQVACRRHSLAGRGKGEASSLVELHVSNTTHGLDLGLEGAEVVVVSVVTALKQVLVASVAGVLVTHPTERHGEGGGQSVLKQCLPLVLQLLCHGLYPLILHLNSIPLLVSLGLVCLRCHFKHSLVTFVNCKTFGRI